MNDTLSFSSSHFNHSHHVDGLVHPPHSMCLTFWTGHGVSTEMRHTICCSPGQYVINLRVTDDEQVSRGQEVSEEKE